MHAWLRKIALVGILLPTIQTWGASPPVRTKEALRINARLGRVRTGHLPASQFHFGHPDNLRHTTDFQTLIPSRLPLRLRGSWYEDQTRVGRQCDLIFSRDILSDTALYSGDAPRDISRFLRHTPVWSRPLLAGLLRLPGLGCSFTAIQNGLSLSFDSPFVSKKEIEAEIQRTLANNGLPDQRKPPTDRADVLIEVRRSPDEPAGRTFFVSEPLAWTDYATSLSWEEPETQAWWDARLSRLGLRGAVLMRYVLRVPSLAASNSIAIGAHYLTIDLPTATDWSPDLEQHIAYLIRKTVVPIPRQ